MTLPANFRELGGPSGWSKNAAPASAWNALIAAVGSGALGRTSRKVILNVSGESLPIYGSPASGGWTIGDVVDFCHGGGVWVDYCGFPFFSQKPNPTYSDTGANGFATFLDLSGALLPYDTFRSSGLQNVALSGATVNSWPYVRSLMLRKAPPTVPWFVPNLHARTARPFALSYAGTGNPVDYWVYASFAILVGRGAYCYAYGGMSGGFLQPFNTGVDAGEYAAFLDDLVPYIGQGGAQPITTTGGGTTPTSGSGSGTTPTSGGTPTQSTGTPSTALSPLATAAAVAAVAALGIGGYMLTSGDE